MTKIRERQNHRDNRSPPRVPLTVFPRYNRSFTSGYNVIMQQVTQGERQSESGASVLNSSGLSEGSVLTTPV